MRLEQKLQRGSYDRMDRAAFARFADILLDLLEADRAVSRIRFSQTEDAIEYSADVNPGDGAAALWHLSCIQVRAETLTHYPDPVLNPEHIAWIEARGGKLESAIPPTLWYGGKSCYSLSNVGLLTWEKGLWQASVDTGEGPKGFGSFFAEHCTTPAEAVKALADAQRRRAARLSALAERTRKAVILKEG